MSKTHWKKTMNKDYLGSWDLDERQEVEAKILRVDVQEVKDQNGKTSKCNVAILEGLKPMILNVTNCRKLKKFTGSNYIEDWTNVPVIIHAVTVKAFGEETEGLRIRDWQPKENELKQGTKQWDNALDFLKKGGDIKKIQKKYKVDTDKLKKDAGIS